MGGSGDATRLDPDHSLASLPALLLARVGKLLGATGSALTGLG